MQQKLTLLLAECLLMVKVLSTGTGVRKMISRPSVLPQTSKVFSVFTHKNESYICMNALLLIFYFFLLLIAFKSVYRWNDINTVTEIVSSTKIEKIYKKSITLKLRKVLISCEYIVISIVNTQRPSLKLTLCRDCSVLQFVCINLMLALIFLLLFFSTWATLLINQKKKDQIDKATKQ